MRFHAYNQYGYRVNSKFGSDNTNILNLKKFCDIIIDSQKKVDFKKLIKILNEEVNE